MNSLVLMLTVGALWIVCFCPVSGADYQYERGGVLFCDGFNG